MAWVVLSTTSGLAYDVGPASSETAPAVITPGVPFTVTATFIGSDGVPLRGFSVVWSSSTITTAAAPARSDGILLMAHVGQAVLFKVCTISFNPPVGTTNATGVVSTTALDPVGCFGTFTLTATIPGVGSVSAEVTATAGAAGGAFPNTSRLAGRGLAPAVPVAILGTLVLLSLAVVLWLRSRSRRALD